MKINVGDFIRTEHGIISQVKGINSTVIGLSNRKSYKLVNNDSDNSIWIEDKSGLYKVTKSSPNIIDLVEDGDYVNGCKVHRIGNCITIILDNEENISWVNPSDIKSIITREQIEQVSYKVGEE